MVLKNLRLHQFLMVWHEFSLHTSMCVGEGEEFENVSKKGCFLSFEWQTKQFHHF